MGRPKGSTNKAKLHQLNELSDHIKEVKSFRVSYDFGNFEGGIAVYVSYGDHGAIIVSIPRLGLSTCVLHDSDVNGMLLKNNGFYHNRSSAEQFSTMILRDIKLYRHKGA